MKLTLLQTAISSKAQDIARTTSNRSTVQILGGIYLEARNGSLLLRSNDMELATQALVPAQVNEEGAIVLPGKVFAEIMRKFPETNISISTNDRTLTATIQSSNAEYVIKGLDPSEFPVFPNTEETPLLKIKAVVLKSAIRQTIFVTSTSGQPVLTGALLHKEDRTVSMVTVDGVRLAIKTIPLNDDVKGQTTLKAIIPSRALLELSRLLEQDSEDDVEVIANQSQCCFRYKDYTLVTRIIEGEFPPYKQVIPSAFNLSCSVSVTDLYNALERASLLSTDKDAALKISFSPDKLLVESCSQEIGTVKEQLPAKVEGEPLQVSYNARYLMEGLRAISTDEVLLCLGGSTSPTMLKPVADEGFIYVLMPLRTL